MNDDILPRVDFVFSAASPVAVILRRGPSKWVHVLRWDTSNDTIDPGAWFHGRIYSECCDLSPNGQLFYYFAAQYGRNDTREPGYADVLSAVSKPPWLTALALWPCDETWGGEGRFLDDASLMISRPHWNGPLVPHPRHVPQNLTVTEKWIGRDAPFQSLAEPPARKATFDSGTGRGVDVPGRPFRLDQGQLYRETDGAWFAIFDFRNLRPRRTKSPDWARRW